MPKHLVLDSTYLLPAFGVDLELDSSETIVDTLDRIARSGSRLYVSDLSPLECFLKAFQIAEKMKIEEGKEAARVGILAVTGDSSAYAILTHYDEKILAGAFVIRNSHKDPFDCFIFGTAKAFEATLVTEDTGDAEHIGAEGTLSWKELKKLL